MIIACKREEHIFQGVEKWPFEYGKGCSVLTVVKWNEIRLNIRPKSNSCMMAN